MPTVEEVSEWIRMSDFYVWPHIEYFDSVAELHSKVSTFLKDPEALLRRHVAMREAFDRLQRDADLQVGKLFRQAFQQVHAAPTANKEERPQTYLSKMSLKFPRHWSFANDVPHSSIV
eukprot:gnl/MRDRNA2_/MRDRNA2_554047_c0_seq1.p1 gnl/MRDRNA2_/MRDRNA2_554047_c0~~gnl/MRDRNA2_/MRDRNA2_554047_c0_seq1.p1  ORF type:complete len:138 (+),score=27.76 gnl/MRDRNA2_/MRDRNA2_554047_c0_seq1:62-415(+)